MININPINQTMETQKLKRITVYNIKGGTGKTRIALNIALEMDFGIISNDCYSVIEKVLPAKRSIILKPDQPLPQLPAEIPIVFDLGGYPDTRAIEVLKQSQFVLMPILTRKEDLQISLDFIQEIIPHNQNIIILINRTIKNEFQKIKKVCKNFYPKLPVFELKESMAMSRLVDQKMSINKIAVKNKLQRRHYEKIAKQFDIIIKYLKSN